jgi:sugar O-acyltransferase (sialic acid O-acetyltransferase NeuD family)
LKNLVLIGGGGHCKSCIEVVHSTTAYKIIGIVDSTLPVGTHIMGYPVLGDDTLIPSLIQQDYVFLISIGKLNTFSPRQKIFDTIKGLGGAFATIIASTAYVSSHATIGEGSIIMHGAFLNVDAVIEQNCIINTRAIIEHDTRVKSHSHISTHVVLNGGVEIGSDCFIGSGSVVLHKTKIADNVIVGSHSTVVKDLLEATTYVGTPAKPIINN